MKYKKISKDDVYKVLVNVRIDISGFNCINLVNIASFLDTSRYQVKKYIKELKNDGMVKLIYFSYIDYYGEENIPPYWGYRLTEKGEDTDYFREAEKRELKLIEECFG